MGENEVIEAEEAEELSEDAADEETTPVEEAEETQEDEEPVEDDDDNTPYGVKKRIGKVVFQREEEKRARLATEEKNVRLKKELDAANEKAAQGSVTEEPRIEDFDTDAEFIKSYTKWTIDQRTSEAKVETEKDRRERETQEAQESFGKTITQINNSGKGKFKDYEDVVFSLPPEVMNFELATLISETETPEEIAYHLGKNPVEAERISQLPTRKKALALGRIENRLSLKKTTSKAPPPINPVKGKDSGSINIDDLSPEEYARLKNAGKI